MPVFHSAKQPASFRYAANHLRRATSWAIVSAVALIASTGVAVAQQPAAPATTPAKPAAQDEVSQKASQLEAELGKHKDTSPEAANAMVELVNLYHQDARLFGLVRVGQTFASAHPADPRHQDVMLKLIDGLEALSRNKDLAASCRQFLARYPAHPQAAAVEIRLADAMAQQDDRARAAEAAQTVWTRQGTNETGLKYGIRAMQLWFSVGNGESTDLGAQQAETMFDKLPAGEIAREVGLESFEGYRRIGQWAKSAAVGQKLLAKGLGGTGEKLQNLHLRMAENYGNVSQHANAADSLKQARAIKDGQWTHFQLIQRMHYAAAKPGELEPIVNQYVSKYADRTDRFQTLGYLAHSYLQAGDRGRAISLFEQVLADDPMTNSNAAVYVREIGTEAPQWNVAVQKVSAAIGQKKPGVHYLRYVLAFDLYRDRIKDNADAKRVLREFLSQSPTDDGHTHAAIDWLLSNAADDNEFRADLSLVGGILRKNPQYGSLREVLKNWSNSARQNKDLKPRGELATEELKKSQSDPIVAAWIEQRGSQYGNGEPIRSKLLEPGTFAQLNDDAARSLLGMQLDYFRHHAPGNKRAGQIPVAAQWCQRFPSDHQAAYYWLETATDHGKPDEMRAAADHFMKLPPQVASGDHWRRLLHAAEKNELDTAMARRAFAYIQAAEKKFYRDLSNATTIGDLLFRCKLETEAIAWWTVNMEMAAGQESRESAARIIERQMGPARTALLHKLLEQDTDFHGRYAMLIAGDQLAAGDIAGFVATLKKSKERQLKQPLRGWDFDMWTVGTWVDQTRGNQEMSADVKKQILTAIRDLDLQPVSAHATLALLEESAVPAGGRMARQLEIQRLTRVVGNEWYDWDRLAPFAQSAVVRKDYVTALTLSTGMLANIPNIDEPRKKALRDITTQSLARLGGVGLTIDDSSPIAPLLQAALYFRLGDERLAFDTYLANKQLFDENRNELPADLLVFVCDRLIAAGGETNQEYVEEILRGWLVKWSESMQVDDPTKARMQLMLARNFFKAQRFDIARSEFTTVVNRYPGTPQATEAEFGIGETFMSQKVYDQAELVFEKLARSAEVDVVVRAEFLRGVLAFRRGDRDEARDIFRAVLERVPNVELANQALFNLAEVYGAEEKYIAQLNLLRTVGRLGRASKRRHVPGLPLSIVVHDSDLGISRGHNRIPVRVTTLPGGDSETVYLTGAGAGKGLFRADIDTRLGQASVDDGVLQLTGNDTIRCDYPEQFKAEFRNVPLSDVEIRVASDARFEVASSPILDQTEATFSQKLQDEVNEENADNRRSQVRPSDQIKPGNIVHLRVKDPDRDLTNEPDTIVVKLTADSGDQVQVKLMESGPHTGIFEGTAKTGELPAGALATDTAIDHSPLMAIDRDPQSFWMSEPNGVTPKLLTVDMKDVYPTPRVRFTAPDAMRNYPIRGDLYGSQDGEFWFRLATYPERPLATPLAQPYSEMTATVYAGNLHEFKTWQQIADHSKNARSIATQKVEMLHFVRDAGNDDSNKSFGVIWQGKLAQPRTGAVRILVDGITTAVVVDGVEELPPGRGGRTVDLWLKAGMHDIAIFAASQDGQARVEARIARADLTADQVKLRPFRAADFDPSTIAATDMVQSGPATAIPLLASTAKFEKKTEQFGVKGEGEKATIGYWQAVEDKASWDVQIPATGLYEVLMNYSHQGAGGRFRVSIGDKSLECSVPDTGNWETFRTDRVGMLLIEATGASTLTITPIEIQNGGLMDLRGVALRPAKSGIVVQGPLWDFHFPETPLRYVRLATNEYRGEAVAFGNVEVFATEPGKLYIPTQEDVLGLAENDTLEIAAGDTITATYTDEVTLNDLGGSQLLTGKLQATYFNAGVAAISYDFEKQTNGSVQTVRKELRRLDPGERIVFEVTDYDEDRTADRDTVKFEVLLNDGSPVELIATETEENSGTFTKEIDTSLTNEAGKMMVKPGDRVYLRYVDNHNTFPGHSVPRETVIDVVRPTPGIVRVLNTRVTVAPEGSKAPPQISVIPSTDDAAISGMAFEAPLTIEVIDPDAAKDSRSTVPVIVTTTDGAIVEVLCTISSAFAPAGAAGDEEWALDEGRFVGQVILQLGGKNSPAVVPLTTNMPRNLVGRVKVGEEGAAEQRAGANLVTKVLNLTGKDIATAVYSDARRPEGPAVDLSARGRLISNGQLAVTDRDYDKPITQLHVGERIYLRVTDADLDSSDARDVALVEVTSQLGEKEVVRLEETLAHSGVFTGSLQLRASDKPTAGNLDSADAAIETYFGDTLTIAYVDSSASTESGSLPLSVEIPVVVGTDGLIAAFSKTFSDETLAVETRFRIAESYFELFKSHKTLERDDEKKIDLEAGRRILREVMEDYPDPKYAPRVAYLLGQFAQELSQWDEAIRSYDLILRQYPDHTLAPDAQYKLAQCYEEAGDFDQALEAYVTLAATHPKSPLIPNVMIRISDYFYKAEKFEIAAQVGEKFLERFEGHQHAPRLAFRVGQCYYKSKKYETAGESFDQFAKLFPDDPLGADALFWAGESFRLGGEPREAFIRYNNCRWKYAESEAAKYARGRLALPEMLQQFESEAASVDED